MATAEDLSREQWDGTNPAGRANLLRIVREQKEGLFDLVGAPEHWEAPTASGHWQVRDIIAHLVDTTEGYIERFDATRAGGPVEAIASLDEMARTADERALKFRGTPREELLERLNAAFEKAMGMFEAVSDDDWGGFVVTHGYMGPLPAWFYPIAQLMDYGVHSWDVREGLDLPHFLSADVADMLVPFMFIVWQATVDATRLEGSSVEVGVRVSGRNAGTFRFACTSEGMTYEPADIDGMDCILEFDPASLVLTAFGRIRGGTAYGDLDVARRFSKLFFRI